MKAPASSAPAPVDLKPKHHEVAEGTSTLQAGGRAGRRRRKKTQKCEAGMKPYVLQSAVQLARGAGRRREGTSQQGAFALPAAKEVGCCRAGHSGHGLVPGFGIA